ncbi:MAG: hypothetical protein C0401_08405 [Anaerolinea sp.]|nr:hypothetical protein [Anaerolinea sp.]
MLLRNTPPACCGNSKSKATGLFNFFPQFIQFFSYTIYSIFFPVNFFNLKGAGELISDDS